MARVCEDLKEIISHLNISAKAQDKWDPVHQIGKVGDGGCNSYYKAYFRF